MANGFPEEHGEGPADLLGYVHGTLSSFALLPLTRVAGWSLHRPGDVIQTAKAELCIINATCSLYCKCSLCVDEPDADKHGGRLCTARSL